MNKLQILENKKSQLKSKSKQTSKEKRKLDKLKAKKGELFTLSSILVLLARQRLLQENMLNCLKEH